VECKRTAESSEGEPKKGVTIRDKLYAIKDDATGYLKSEREMLAKKSVLTLGTSSRAIKKRGGGG